MHRIMFTLALTSTIAVGGCRSTTSTPRPAIPVSSAPSGQSLAEMRAEWAKLRQRYAADCLTGTPDHIRSTQALCEKERKNMDPLGNALAAAELKAAHQTNP
jgi:hypothetical protein